jgi:hypothetical protein
MEKKCFASILTVQYVGQATALHEVCHQVHICMHIHC